MKHTLAAALLLLGCDDSGRRPADGPEVPAPADSAPAPDQSAAAPPVSATTGPDTAAERTSPIPPPARPPDTVGTRRPIPPRTPATVVPDAEPR